MIFIYTMYKYSFFIFVGHCQGDIYACLQGNNVSCRLACETYGRVTCLTYQNKRACEQYNQQLSIMRQFNMNSTRETSVFMNDIHTFQYTIYASIGILLLLSIISIVVYLIRRKPSIQKSDQQFSSSHSRSTPPSYYYYYSDESTSSINDSYEPPPYPGSPSSTSSLSRSDDSIYYETIQILSMASTESNEFPNIRRHCV